MDGWNTFSFPFGAETRPIFRGEKWLVSGSVKSIHVGAGCHLHQKLWVYVYFTPVIYPFILRGPRPQRWIFLQ